MSADTSHLCLITVKDYRPDNTEQFVERENQEIDDNEYPRKGKDAGLVVIFNHEHFNNLDLRKGSRRDVNELIQSFGRVGYNIEKRYIHNDLTRKQVKAELKTRKPVKFGIKIIRLEFFHSFRTGLFGKKQSYHYFLDTRRKR